MNAKKTQPKARQLRHRRVRAKIVGSGDRPRLSVFRSNRFVYAFLVDDVSGKTLFSVSDKKETKTKAKTSFAKVDRAYEVGQKIAELAKSKKIKSVVFDRGGYRYTGRVAGVAKGAREGGLEF